MGPEQILTLLLEEYKTLRTQVLNDLDRQYSVTNWGISSTAVAILGIATTWDKLRGYPTVLLALLLLVLPTVVTGYALAWSHILRSTLGAGAQLFQIERRATRLFTRDEVRLAFHLTADERIEDYQRILSWEHSLRMNTRHSLVRPVVWLVRCALAGVYTAAVTAAVLACRHLYGVSLQQALKRAEIVMAAGGWLLVWIMAFGYLGRAGAVGEEAEMDASTDHVSHPNAPALPLAFEFKDAMTLLMSLSQRAHHAWAAHIAGALVVGGWLLTRPAILTGGEVTIVVVAVVLGTALNMFATLAIYRYFNAVMKEVKAAASGVRFWNDEETRRAIADLRAISPPAVVAINCVVAIMLIAAAVVVNL